MEARSVIAIGASEGGIEAVSDVLAALPGDLPAAVFVVQHIGAHRSELPSLLNHRTALHAVHPSNRDEIQGGRVYVAPPDHHMVVVDGVIRLTKGPRENFARPSIDPLFRSLAKAYGPAVIGVILTGGLNDGVAGLYEIKRRGGTSVVQDPCDAVNSSMPRNALIHVDVDHCVPLTTMPALLVSLVTALSVKQPKAFTTSDVPETDMSTPFKLSRPVALTCPDCGGALRQSQLGTLTQFRCHIGHLYTAEAMVDGQFTVMEAAIEVALRSLNERVEVCRHMAENADNNDDSTAAIEWRRALNEAETRAATLIQILERDWTHPEPRPSVGSVEPPRKSRSKTAV